MNHTQHVMIVFLVDFDFDTQSYFSEDNKRMEVELCAYIFNNAEKRIIHLKCL